MNVAILHGERNLTELVNRLYQMPEVNTRRQLAQLPADQREPIIQKAVEVLRQANPTLANLAALPQGTVIVVPPIEGLAHTDAVRPGRSLSEEILAGVVETTKEALKEIEQSAQERGKQLGELLKAFESSEVNPLLKKFASFSEARKATEEETSALTKSQSKLKEFHKEILDQMKDDVAELTKQF